MTHSDTIVYGNSVKLGSKTTQLLDFGFYLLTDFVQMSVSRNKLGKRVDDSDNGLTHHFLLHSVGHPERSGSCHAATFCTHRTA